MSMRLNVRDELSGHHYSIAQDYAYDVQRNFETELKNLLVAITKERKSLQE
jgi:hypothetical protein